MRSLLSITLCLCLFNPTAFAQETCPPCITDQTPFPGHGSAPDGSGRRVVLLYIDSSWDIPGSPGNTVGVIFDGVIRAIDKWNNATDNFGNRTFYFFALDQNNGRTNKDYVIEKAPNEAIDGGCADHTYFGSFFGGRNTPDRIRLGASLQNKTANQIAATVAHEMGHGIGLENENVCVSIMNGHPGNCVQLTQNVQARDVAKCNQQADPNTRARCNEPPSSGGGGGGVEIIICIPGGGDGFAEQCPSPILIDTQGNGFDLTDAPTGVDFDIDGNGTLEHLAWTTSASDDCWLALDRNANSSIDDGTELFGNFTPQPESNSRNGFIALAEFDKPLNGGNSDGRLDNGDSIFSSLRLWQDANHNGLSESSELFSLPAQGVSAIDLDYKEKKRRDEHENWFRYRAKVYDVRGDQAGRWAWDVFLTRLP